MEPVSPPTTRRRAPRPPAREECRAFRAEVIAARQLTPRMRRITLRAAQLADLIRIRPDDFFGLILPDQVADLVDGVAISNSPRRAAEQLSFVPNPVFRWYTVRRHRPEAAEIDVDIVLYESSHGGPGSRWAASTVPGDVVGFCEGNPKYEPPLGCTRQVFFADDTAVPALAALLEASEPAPGWPRLQPADAVVHAEVEDEHEVQLIETDVEIHWHLRSGRPVGAALTELVPTLDLTGVGYAWVCAEASATQTVRRQLVDRHGLAKEQIMFSGYWNLGRAQR